jgi:hypothetical protein
MTIMEQFENNQVLADKINATVRGRIS